MKKKILLNEGQYQLLFESLDDNPEAKIKQLIDSSQKENIELAFMLIDSQNLDKETILKSYQETFEFLKLIQEFTPKTQFNIDALVKMGNMVKVALYPYHIDNLATIGSNVLRPQIINGKPLKSINQHYNKQKAHLQSILETTNKHTNQKSSKRIQSITNNRNNKIKDFLHKASRYIVNHAVSNQINTIVIGYNKGWKQEINIGSKNNQNFVSIPFHTFLTQLQYKTKLEGINVVVHEESYTSKCSFLDNEPLKKHDAYLGKRVKRGLFCSSSGKKINADVNGSLNILRKVVGDFCYPIQVCSTPLLVRLKR
jgi:putative transposase